MINRRQFTKALVGLGVAIAIPACVPACSTKPVVPENFPWGDNKTAEEILEDVERAVFSVRYDNLSAKHYST